MLERVKNIVDTDVFDRFHFFVFFVNFEFLSLNFLLFGCFLVSVFWEGPGPHSGDFGPLLGCLLETILVTFGVPFLDRFSEDFRSSPKVRVGLEVGGFGRYLGSS